jgi:hypothetical protein
MKIVIIAYGTCNFHLFSLLKCHYFSSHHDLHASTRMALRMSRVLDDMCTFLGRITSRETAVLINIMVTDTVHELNE